MSNPWIDSLTPERRQEGIDWVTSHRPDLVNYAGDDSDFALWLAAVDQRIAKALGLGMLDLADFQARPLYDDGMTPREGAMACLAFNDLDDLLGGA